MKFNRRISRRSFLAAAGVTSAALALTACGGSSSSTAASSAASGASSAAAGTAQGGTLNIMLETEVQSLDPQVATDGTSFEVIADYTDGLMQMDADGAAVPAMAETYDISEDGKTYTFHLKDAKWSNGDAVTAADFVFGWQRAVDPANASEYAYMLSDIGQVVNAAEIIAGDKPVTDLGVTAVDDKTLKVELNVPVSYFLSLMYFPTFYPMNQKFFESCGDTYGTSADTVLSNGEAVTAADFVFGWQRAVDPATASEYSYMLSDIGQVVNAAEIIAGEKPVTDLGVTAVDDKTLEVQLNVPVSYFLSLMYFPTFYPVNEAFYNTCADTFGTSPETVLSNGAFVLTDYQPAATAFAMEKNPDYYDADKIALDGLAYQVIKDSQQALMSYQTGTLDITLLNGEQVDQVKDDPEFTSVGAGYLWYISPNIDAVPDLANLNLRKAMTFALDRDAITGDVLKDGSTPAYTAVPAQFATGPDGSDFSADQTKFADDCAYDPEKAKEFFETAKAELGKDTFTFDMVVDADDAPQKVAQVVKEQLETTLEGLTINLTVEPKKQRVQDMQDGTFELGLTRWGPDYADPMTYLGMWVTGNSNNYGLWSDADYDAVIDECTTGDLCTDPEGRWAALYEAEQIVLEQAVIFPLYGQCNAEMISSAVKGVEHHPCALNRVYKNTTKSE